VHQVGDQPRLHHILFLHQVIQEGLRYFLAVTSLLSTENRVEFQGRTCGICGGKSVTRAGFTWSSSVVLYFANVSYTSIRHPWMDRGPEAAVPLRQRVTPKQEDENTSHGYIGTVRCTAACQIISCSLPRICQ